MGNKPDWILYVNKRLRREFKVKKYVELTTFKLPVLKENTSGLKKIVSMIEENYFSVWDGSGSIQFQYNRAAPTEEVYIFKSIALKKTISGVK